jgi:hypothetical protein
MVMVFLKSMGPDATRVVVETDKLVKKNQAAGLRGYVIFLGGPGEKNAIEKLAAEKGISIPMAHSLTPFPGDREIAKWNVNPEAKSTIVVSKGNRVSGNFVNVDAKAFPSVAAAAEKLLAPGE